MTAPSRLLGLSNERYGRPTKGMQDAVSASLTLATTPGPFITYTGGVEVANGGQWLDIGNAPGIDVMVAFTHGGTAAVISILAVFANPAGGDASVDPTIGAPASYIPADTDGTNVSYPNVVTFDKAIWTTTTSPLSSASVKYARGYIKANGKRLVSLYGFVDSITGAPTAVIYVCAGTTE